VVDRPERSAAERGVEDRVQDPDVGLPFQGAKALVAELVVGELARAVGLRVPELVLVEIDPREGSGVIPRDWAAFLGPKGADAAAVRGTSRPELDKLKGLRGVYRRDYNYEQFWVVFPARREDGQPLFGPEDDGAELTVRILDKEGHVSFKVPR